MQKETIYGLGIGAFGGYIAGWLWCSYNYKKVYNLDRQANAIPTDAQVDALFDVMEIEDLEREAFDMFVSKGLSEEEAAEQVDMVSQVRWKDFYHILRPHVKRNWSQFESYYLNE